MSEFADEIIKFYKSFIVSSASAIQILARIQKNFPDQYKVMNELKDDPSVIEQLTVKMTPKQVETLLLIIMKASNLGRRSQNLFDLSVEEKEKLVKDLRDFARYVENALKTTGRGRANAK